MRFFYFLLAKNLVVSKKSSTFACFFAQITLYSALIGQQTNGVFVDRRGEHDDNSYERLYRESY